MGKRFVFPTLDKWSSDSREERTIAFESITFKNSKVIDSADCNSAELL